MFAKLTTALALFSVAAQVAVAAPPSCLLAAVNTQDNPADMATVCDSGAASVKKYLSSKCGDNADAAMEAFQSACKDAGVSVSTSTSSSSASKSSSGSSHSATGTKSASASASEGSSTGTMTSSPSGTLAPYPIGTGAASSGFSTATSNSTGYAAPSSASGSSPAGPTESTIASSTGGAARMGMDIVGLAAVGIFGAMLAL